MRIVTIIGAVICFIFVVLYMIVADINFSRNCEGYLKRAGDANTVALAEDQLTIALEYIEKRELTSGNSSLLWQVPRNDLGFWYQNLNSSLEELRGVPAEATQLERSNVLMKLRETLLDDTSSGLVVTHPRNISIYPNVRVFWTILLLCVVAGVVALFWPYPRYY